MDQNDRRNELKTQNNVGDDIALRQFCGEFTWGDEEQYKGHIVGQTHNGASVERM